MRKLILLIAILTASAFAAKSLSVPEIEQRKDQWCWAGSSTAILTYYGESVTQGKIVQFSYGDSSINQWNWLFGNSAVDYNGKTYYPKGIDYIMTNWNTPHGGGGYPLTEAQYKSEIDAGHPFVIRYGWTAGGGHFVVGTGYLDNGSYELMNPWFGEGYTVNTYNWIKTAEGGRGSWTHTLTTNRSPVSAKYALTVNGGTGSGSYASGTTVTVTAQVPSGKQFVKWSSADGVLFANASSASTTITMIGKAASVTAEFKDIAVPTYALTVNGGTGSGSYASGTTVTVTAQVPSGKQFVKWSSADGVLFANASSASTTITMIGKAASVTAEFKDITVPTYALTVNGGTGSGSYASGTTVTVTAQVPSGKQFVKWSSADGVLFADASSASTTITMIGKAASVTAEFKDIAVPTYALTVNGGTGSGSYASGTTVTVTAQVPSGKQFVKWSSADGVLFANASSASTTITMIGKAATVTAEFTDLEVIDTSALSKNFVIIGAWESLFDEIGSSVSIDSSGKADGILKSEMKITADNESLGENGYAWGKITVSAKGLYDSADCIKLTYTATDSIRIVLDNAVLAAEGVSHGFTLAKSLKDTTVVISLKSFIQPEWTADSLKSVLDRTKIESISIEAAAKNSMVSAVLSALQVNRFKESESTAILKFNGTELPNIQVGREGVRLFGIEGTVQLAVYSLSGRVMFEKTAAGSAGETFAELPELGTGIHILRITAPKQEMIFKMR